MTTSSLNSFNARDTLKVGGTEYQVYRLDALAKAGAGHVDRLPFSLRILLENLVRREDGEAVPRSDIEALAGWLPASAEASPQGDNAKPDSSNSTEIAFMPALTPPPPRPGFLVRRTGGTHSQSVTIAALV